MDKNTWSPNRKKSTLGCGCGAGCGSTERFHYFTTSTGTPLHSSDVRIFPEAGSDLLGSLLRCCRCGGLGIPHSCTRR